MALPLAYNVRNVRVRWQVTLLAVVGIALVVAVFAVLLSMSEGFTSALRSTGRADTAMVVQRGSGSELTSGVPIADPQLDHTRVRKVSDVVNEGDEVMVKVIEIDKDGRIRLSRKAVLPKAEQ